MFKAHLKRMLLFMAVFGTAGWLYASRLDAIYQATVDIRAGSPAIGLDPNIPSEMARTLAPSVSNDLEVDAGLLKSQKVFAEGLTRAAQVLNKPSLDTADSFARLYSMYEVNVPAAQNPYSQSQQRIVQLSVKAFDPVQAAEIANQVGYAFDDLRKQTNKTSVEDLTRELRRKQQEALAKTTKLQSALAALKQKNAVPDIAGRNGVLTQSLETITNQRETALASEAGIQAELAKNESLLASTPKQTSAGTTAVADPAVDIMKSQVAAARVDYESARETFLDSAPQVIESKKKLSRLQTQLDKAVRNRASVEQSSSKQINPAYLQIQSAVNTGRANLAQVRAQINAYDDTIARKRAEAVAAPDVEREAIRLQRDYDVANREYVQLSSVMQNYDQVGVTSRVPAVLRAADPGASAQVAPEVRRWVILSLFAGALLGLAYSFAIESLRLPVHTSWQLAELTALPVSAAVPAMPKPLARRHESEIREGAFKPIESFRYMAFSLLARADKPRTMMFTGVGPVDVGAANSAAEFAVAVARTGATTILVDADLRNPHLSGIFGFAGRSGLSDILGRTTLPGTATELLVPTEHENLMILPAGSTTEAGLADFQTTTLKGLLDDLASRADMVVINCPSVDVYSDAARLAQYVDETCLVISAKTTSYRAIPMAQEIVEKAGAKSVSIVLTNASPNDEPFGARVTDSLVRS